MNDEHPPLDMDAVTAHLDRGWDLLSRGDLTGARLSADHILKRNEQSPEGQCLLGSIAAAEGEPEEALELFQQAMELEPGYVEPVLHAAQLCIHALGDLELGLQFCRDAETMRLDKGDSLEVRLLGAEATMALGQDAKALRLVRGLPKPPYEDPDHHLRLGRILAELGELIWAEEVLAEALTHAECRAEAHYFTGIVLERGGDVVAARRHMARSLELERGAPPAYVPLEQDEIGALVEQALEQLDPRARRWYQGVPVTVMDHPPMELVAEGLDPRCPAFASGFIVPAVEGQGSENEQPPEERDVTHLFIYRRNVERVGPDWELMADLLQQSLEQELEDLLANKGG